MKDALTAESDASGFVSATHFESLDGMIQPRESFTLSGKTGNIDSPTEHPDAARSRSRICNSLRQALKEFGEIFF